MPQTSYNFLMTVAVAGQIYDLGFLNVLTPVAAVEPIPIGLGVAKILGQDMQVMLPRQDIAALTETGTLVSGNSTVVTLNGIALTPVVWATSNAVTLANIAALIAAQPGIASAVSNGTDTITVTAANGFPVTVTAVTTVGTVPTWATVYTNDNVFYGISMFIQNKMNLIGPQGSAGAAPYFKGDAVSTMTRGRIYVTVEVGDTVTSDSPVYWRNVPSLTNLQVGAFRSDPDGGKAILLASDTVRWITSATAGNLAVLEINQP